MVRVLTANWSSSSLDGLVSVSVLLRAFSAQVKLSILSCPLIPRDSKADSNRSRKSIMAGSVSKSVKWLCTHSRRTRVT